MSYNVESIINHILDDDANSRRFVKDPCSICNKTIKSGQLALQCNFCMHFIHIGCNGTSQEEYNHHDYSVWNCLLCNITRNLDRLPFTKINNTELININHTDSMKFLESFPNVEIINETKTFSNFSSNDINNVLPSKTSCKKIILIFFMPMLMAWDLNWIF